MQEMNMLLKAVLFLGLTIVIGYYSRTSILRPRSHGFYRFFAWETCAGLAAWNLDSWFVDPFSPAQILSWLFLIISFVLIVHGVSLFRKFGKPQETRVDASLIGVEKTTYLVTNGAYRYIRHPFYSSLLFLAWGTCLKSISPITLSLSLAATFFIILTGKAEESEDVEYFGEEYRIYMKKTKMFIPFVF
jgi:protein-S-isoprenylcysteine O-methyltransferase Ste14